MSKVKFILTFLVVFIFLISFVAAQQDAQGCDGAGWKGFAQLHENKTVCVTCPTCNFINITATNGEGNVFLINDQMAQDGSTFCYEFNTTQNDVLGTYQIDGYSQLAVPLGLCYDVTLSGNFTNVGAYIIILVFLILAFMGLIWFNVKFNVKEREKLYNKVVIQYFKFNGNKTKSNLGYALLYLIAYGALRMIFVFYYLLIFIFIVVFSEIVAAFGIVSLEALMPQIFIISFIGLILVGVVAIAILMEVIFTLLGDIRAGFRGVGHER